MAEPYYLTPDKIRLESQDGKLVLSMDGQRIVLGPPRRAMPLSEPDVYIVFNDEEGNEVGILKSVASLEPVSQQILREALAEAYVLIRINRILEVDKEPLTGQTRWRVEIDPAEYPKTPETSDEEEVEVSPETLNGKGAGGVTTSKPGEDESDEDETDENSDQPGRLQRVGRLFRLNRDTEKSVDSQQAEEREFLINGQEDVQTARYPHIYIVDIERNRYEIVNCEALDSDSRKAAERFF